MWLDTRPVYVPGMKYRTRLFPLKTWLMLAVVCGMIVLLGDRAIHGYFALVQRAGDAFAIWWH